MSAVYVIAAEGGPVKIGVATNPAKRLAALRTGTPFPLSLVHVEPIAADLRAVAVERRAHDLLKGAQAHGEWFTVSVEEARAAIRMAIGQVQRHDTRAHSPTQGRCGADAVQCRMARAALGLGVREMASVAGVASGTIVRLEAGARLQESTVLAIRKSQEAAGVEFIPKNGGGGAGVRLRKINA